MASIEPYTIRVPDFELEKLREKLSHSTFPDELDGAGRDLGAPLSDIKRLVEHWRTTFDWRSHEKKLNRLAHYMVGIEVEGFGTLKIHFIHQKSDVKQAIPLLFCHGWPGSFIEVTKILDQLTVGGGTSPAFHVVAISLPNFAFSKGPKKTGFSLAQYAETCHKLMLRLGYDEYVTQGVDWGFYVTRLIGFKYPNHCRGSHYNADSGTPPSWVRQPWQAIKHFLTPYTEREKQGMERSEWFMKEGIGYAIQHETKPQTIGYALADSPVALLAWVYEKLYDWTDNYPWTDDEVLTWISIYWFSTSGPAASVRIYYEMAHEKDRKMWSDIRQGGYMKHVKIGMSHFPRDIRVLPNAWTRNLGNVVYESFRESGGHFAAWEQPEMVVEDLQKMFGRDGPAYALIKGSEGYTQ
ncbi:alpha/beta-hydrolase [Zopfia rhizophila CBS 207.26]|uniref:Alpha/beta-hydrolase n=1 Tax=Zopfia rhizophila CBS 207.26 TaxID=1314779 RepID=A0A6A6DMR3_9PEZI|nr:alpha/beta-hydrolase [Zopfia rhizophila CBS 207.26]